MIAWIMQMIVTTDIFVAVSNTENSFTQAHKISRIESFIFR